MPRITPLSPGAVAVLDQLWQRGPTWDGYILSKSGRQELIEIGLVDRRRGYAFLTPAGVELCATSITKERA